MDPIIFPQFRRYKNHKAYFKIESLESFEEIRTHGKKWIIEKHVVKILPDRNLVNDLLFHYTEFADIITADLYSEVRKTALESLR